MEGYISPSDKAGEAQRLLAAAMRAVPEGARLMVLADLNADLDSPWGRQEDVLAVEASKHGLLVPPSNFGAGGSDNTCLGGGPSGGLCTYTPEGERRWVRGKPTVVGWPCGTIIATTGRILPAPPLFHPITYGDAMFKELVEAIEKPPETERPKNAGVRLGKWSLVDRQAELWKAGTLTQHESRRLTRAIKTSLKLNHQERAWKAGKAIMMELLADNIKEAWRILNDWYQKEDGAATKPCHVSMERQTVEREGLYNFQASPGEHIPANRDPILLPDAAPPDAEIRAAVKALCNGQTVSSSMMRAEDFKGWLRRAEEEVEAAGIERLKGAGDTWRLLVRGVVNRAHLGHGRNPTPNVAHNHCTDPQGKLWGLPRNWLA